MPNALDTGLNLSCENSECTFEVFLTLVMKEIT